MIVVLQRVRRAAVRVNGELLASIGTGLCLLACAVDGDVEDDARWLGDKIAGLRVFPDPQGRSNLGALDVGAAVLLVSQFTLAADWRKGRRPSFTRAADPERAAKLLGCLAEQLAVAGLQVRSGRFGAEMEVELVNHGPFTLILESRARWRPDAADPS